MQIGLLPEMGRVSEEFYPECHALKGLYNLVIQKARCEHTYPNIPVEQAIPLAIMIEFEGGVKDEEQLSRMSIVIFISQDILILCCIIMQLA